MWSASGGALAGGEAKSVFSILDTACFILRGPATAVKTLAQTRLRPKLCELAFVHGGYGNFIHAFHDTPELVAIGHGDGCHDGRATFIAAVIRHVLPDQCFVDMRLEDQHVGTVRPPDRMQTCRANPFPVLPHFCHVLLEWPIRHCTA